MADPTEYDRSYGFANYQASHPSDPLPGGEVDAELDAVSASIASLAGAIESVRRSDGALKNQIVTPESLSTVTTNMIAAAGGNPRGAWLTLTSYAVKDITSQSGAAYMCVTAHASGTFATDLAAGKWVVISNAAANQSLNTSDSPTFAGGRVNGPFGIGMAATNILDITQPQNGASIASFLNANGSGAATAQFRCANGADTTSLTQLGTGFATNGVLIAGRGGLNTSNSMYLQSGGIIAFSQAGTIEAARIGPSGLLVGATANLPGMDNTGGEIGAARGFYSGAGYGLAWDFQTYIHGTSSASIDCVVNSGGVTLALNATSWASISDYRAKNVSGPFVDSGAIIDAVPVHLAAYKVGDTVIRPMFLAHEVAAGGAAHAVVGEKDAVADGADVLQKLKSTDPLIPILWAELRAVRARLAALEAK